MKKLIFMIHVISMLIVNHSFCQEPSIRFEITSKYVLDANYEIEIILPANYDSTRRYPIVYGVDYWLGSKFMPGVLYSLNFSQAIDPVIVVGIGNKGDFNDWQMERTRDLTPYHIPEYDISSSHKAGTRGVTGGADNFLLFIKNELIPLVETRYPSDTLNRGIMGYSWGGLFGVYIMIKNTDLFQKYFFGSPSLQYNDFALIDSLVNMPPDKLSSIKAIYISVGEKESGTMLKGFANLRDHLQRKNIPSLNITAYIIDDEIIDLQPL